MVSLGWSYVICDVMWNTRLYFRTVILFNQLNISLCMYPCFNTIYLKLNPGFKQSAKTLTLVSNNLLRILTLVFK